MRNLFTEFFLLISALLLLFLVIRRLILAAAYSFGDFPDSLRKGFVERKIRRLIAERGSRGYIETVIVAIKTAQHHFPVRRGPDDPRLCVSQASIHRDLAQQSDAEVMDTMDALIKDSHYIWLKIALDTVGAINGNPKAPDA